MPLPIASPPPAAAVPVWRREPFRILFPLGALLSWAGVFHWLLLATHVDESFRVIFHSLAQIEGFLICYAAGFLMTLVPRRTRTRPAAAWEIVVVVACPVATVVLAWYEKWAASQMPWILLLVVLTQFAVRRFRAAGAGPRIPNSFVWVVMALVMALVSTVVTAVAAIEHVMWIHDVGRSMILQGTFASFELGLLPMLLPQITRGEIAGGTGKPRDRWAKLGHLALALVFYAAFFIEVYRPSLGLGLRAAIAALVLAVSARAWRRPTLPGLHRRLVTLAAWMLPAGFALAAVEPQWLTAALHLTFIGSFGLLVMAISVHVVFSHAGRPQTLDRWPWQLAGLAALLAAATVFRLLVGANPAHYYVWLGLAAGCFLTATVLWGFLVVPALAVVEGR